LASREFNPNAYIVGALQGHVRAAEVTALGANLRHAAQTAHAQFLAPGTHLSAITMGGKNRHLKEWLPGCHRQWAFAMQYSIRTDSRPVKAPRATVTDPDTSSC